MEKEIRHTGEDGCEDKRVICPGVPLQSSSVVLARLVTDTVYLI